VKLTTHLHIVLRSGMVELYFHFPHMSSWHSAELIKHRDSFTLPYLVYWMMSSQASEELLSNVSVSETSDPNSVMTDHSRRLHCILLLWNVQIIQTMYVLQQKEEQIPVKERNIVFWFPTWLIKIFNLSCIDIIIQIYCYKAIPMT
jgi:hypothetical protein